MQLYDSSAALATNFNYQATTAKINIPFQGCSSVSYCGIAGLIMQCVQRGPVLHVRYEDNDGTGGTWFAN